MFKSISINCSFKNILQGCISNLKFLNHLSSPLGISMIADITSREISKLRKPTFVFDPVKLMENSLVTWLCPPRSFSQNLQHPTFLKASSTNLSLVRAYKPLGYILIQWTDLWFLFSSIIFLLKTLCLQQICNQLPYWMNSLAWKLGSTSLDGKLCLTWLKTLFQSAILFKLT